MFKKIIYILIFFNLANCGFTPINSVNENKNIAIQNIKIIGGDRKINIALQNNLKRYQQNITDNKFNLTVNTKYEKKIISKNTAGAATKYQLKVIADFKIQYKDKTEEISYVETFNIDNTSDDFENRSYEDTLKENFANSISQKLIFKLLSLL